MDTNPCTDCYEAQWCDGNCPTLEIWTERERKRYEHEEGGPERGE